MVIEQSKKAVSKMFVGSASTMLRDLPPPDLSATPIRFSEEGADADDTHAPAVCLALFSSHRWKKVRIRDRFCTLNSICSKPSMGNDSKSVNYNNSERALPCIPMRVLRSWESMTLRIERVQARIRQSGEFRSEHLDQVKTEIALCELPAVLDLEIRPRRCRSRSLSQRV